MRLRPGCVSGRPLLPPEIETRARAYHHLGVLAIRPATLRGGGFGHVDDPAREALSPLPRDYDSRGASRWLARQSSIHTLFTQTPITKMKAPLRRRLMLGIALAAVVAGVLVAVLSGGAGHGSTGTHGAAARGHSEIRVAAGYLGLS